MIFGYNFSFGLHEVFFGSFPRKYQPYGYFYKILRPGLPTKTKMEIFTKTKMEITYHMEIPKFSKFLSGEKNTFCFGWFFVSPKQLEAATSTGHRIWRRWACWSLLSFFFFCWRRGDNMTGSGFFLEMFIFTKVDFGIFGIYSFFWILSGFNSV